jgi:hypothetical protein
MKDIIYSEQKQILVVTYSRSAAGFGKSVRQISLYFAVTV